MPIQNIIRHIKFLLFISLLTQCTERINVEVGSTYTRLVVEGYLSTDTMQHKIRLTRSGDYFSDKPAQPVSNAIVTIYDEDTTVILYESHDNPGTYLTEPDYYGVPGKTYTLTISQVDIDNNGETEEYTASSKLEPVNPIDSIRLENLKGTDFNIWEVLVYAWDSPATNFYAFKVLRNGHLITDSLHELIVQNDVFFNGNYADGIPAQFLDQGNRDEIIKPGDTVTLEINGITEDYYNFILEAQSEIFYQNPIFSGPPANISSNVSNGSLGFFIAYSVARSSVVFK